MPRKILQSSQLFSEAPLLSEYPARMVGTLSISSHATWSTSLISMWEMEEASGTRTDAHGSNNLTDNNTVGQATGVVGNAADFESSNSEYFTLANNSSIQCGDIDFYWGGFFRIESNTGALQYLIDKNLEYLLYLDASLNLTFYISSGVGFLGNVVWGSALSTGVTYFFEVGHIAASSQIFICVDRGTDVTGSDAGTPGTNSNGLAIGRDQGAAQRYFDGWIDQLLFAKKVPTTAERDFFYNSGAGRAY